MGMPLVESLLWNVPYVLFTLLAFFVLFFAPAGRRLLPAFGLLLMLIDAAGDLVLNVGSTAIYMNSAGAGALALSPGAYAATGHVLNLIYTVGLLLVVIGIVRRVRPVSGRAPDPAWSAPPPAPVAPGYSGPTGPTGNPAHAAPSHFSGGHADPAARPSGPNPGAGPSGPNPGAGAWPASSGRPETGPQPGTPPPGGGSGPHPSAAPPASPGPGGHQPPGPPPQTTG